MKFEKPKRPIDCLPKNPLKAIRDTWKGEHLDSTLENLEKWFIEAIKSTSCIYDENEERRAFVLFYFELQIFVEAIYFYNMSKDVERLEIYKTADYEKKAAMDERTIPENLTEQEKLNPMPLIQKFCNSFSIRYVRIELWDFFEAVTYDAKDTLGNSNFYLNLLTMAEAAYLITSKK